MKTDEEYHAVVERNINMAATVYKTQQAHDRLKRDFWALAMFTLGLAFFALVAIMSTIKADHPKPSLMIRSVVDGGVS